MRPRALEKGAGFEVMIDGLVPRFIQSDPLRFHQILVNLPGNAIKFAESGKIDMRIEDEGAASVSDRIKSSFAGDSRMWSITPGFIAGLPIKLSQMGEFIASKDLAALLLLVRQLLGSASGYGFPQVSEPARTVQRSIRGRQ
jgi:hypothetical protein